MVLGMPRRESTPERWRAALARARKEGVEVRQLVGSGGWIATSGTNQRAAYELDVTGGVVTAVPVRRRYMTILSASTAPPTGWR